MMSFSVSEFRDLYPFRSNFADIGGHRLHYLDEGNGAPLVLLHGNPTWSFMYRGLVLSLRDAYRLIVPDHIGCGLSEKPTPEDYDYVFSRRVTDLEELLERLDLRRNLTLVVHDWGGLIGFAYACRYPDRISRLIILNTTAFFPKSKRKLHWSIRICKNSRVAAYLILRFNLFARTASYLGARKVLSTRVRRAFVAPYDSWPNRIATLRFVQDIPLGPDDRSFALLKDIEENLHRLQDKPMLICWGERDFVFNLDFLRGWRDRFPASEIHCFHQAGHYVLEDALPEISRLVGRFLVDHPLE